MSKYLTNEEVGELLKKYWGETAVFRDTDGFVAWRATLNAAADHALEDSASQCGFMPDQELEQRIKDTTGYNSTIHDRQIARHFYAIGQAQGYAKRLSKEDNDEGS